VLTPLGSALAGYIPNQSVPGLSQPLSRMRDGIARARHVNLLSALTSEIRHETSDAEIRHFATLLNSGDTATPLPGTPHAQ
jgi:GTP cyclohydrolase I